MNVIDIIFYVTERVGEQYRYHVLCNGKGVNIIDIIFYVMEKGVNIIDIIFFVMEKGVNIIDIMCYVMEMGWTSSMSYFM